jgi:hypothetical protein
MREEKEIKDWYDNLGETIENNKYKIGGLAVLGAGVTALYLNRPDMVYAASDAVKNVAYNVADAVKQYGFGAGLRDGFLFDINLIMSLLRGGINKGASWAADGTGITSGPNDIGYWIGYYLMGGGTNTAIGAIAFSRE